MNVPQKLIVVHYVEKKLQESFLLSFINKIFCFVLTQILERNFNDFFALPMGNFIESPNQDIINHSFGIRFDNRGAAGSELNHDRPRHFYIIRRIVSVGT
jgi:hypothetical protein